MNPLAPNQNSTVPDQSPNPEINSSKNFSKFTLIVISIFIALLILGILFLGYKIYQKTLVNTVSISEQNVLPKVEVATQVIKEVSPLDFGFKFASTTNWEVATIEENDGSSVSFRYTSPDNKKTFTVSIFGDVDPEKTTMREWSEKDSKKIDSNTKLDEKNFKVGKNIGTIYGGEVNGKIYKSSYLIRGIEKQIYRIYVDMDKNNNWMSEFDNILKSFILVAKDVDTYNTYKNVQFAYELTYPANWRVREESDNVLLRNYYNPILDLPENAKDLSVSIMEGKNPKQLTVENWFTEKYNDFWTADSKKIDYIKIDGNDAARIYYERQNASYKNVINKGYTYIISRGKDLLLTGYSTTNETPDPVYEKIINSIKFTKFDSVAYSNIKKTETENIVGEDKNGDGIWDYVGGYLNKKYATSTKVKMALSQYVKVVQASLIDYRDKEKSIKHANESERSMNCLMYVLGGMNSDTIRNAYNLRKDAKAILLNTKERVDTYFKYNDQLSGSTFGISDAVKSDCDFDPDIL